MGDRIGRKKVLFITIALMGASTTLIGVLPTYDAVGILAPILLVALRLVQGFGAGAEIAGATVMLAEYAPVKRRGVIASLVSLGTNSGTLAASAIWALLLGVLTEEQLLSWGWRLPFLLSFILLGFALWLRANLKESPVFEERPDVVDGVALTRHEVEDKAAETHESVLEAGLKQRKGKAFFIALGLRFGQAGNSGSSRPSSSATSPARCSIARPSPPRPSSSARCSASSPSRSSACSATASAAARSTSR